MEDTVVRFTGVTKSFRYWSEGHQSLKTFLVRLFQGHFKNGTLNLITVLNNVSFDIRKSEFVALMGRNGAGKSTTLKLISSIYEPTQGKVDVQGTIAPMIELGAGFDNELSGYENIFLNAAILGFSRGETLSKVEKIVEFSELGDFIDMPVKNYSSGMMVRLGFSVATNLDAPILLVDEVLAVGDVAFQQKCISKIQELHRQGRTIILVTHSPEQVLQFASRVIVFDGGKVAFDGTPAEGVAFYLDGLETDKNSSS